MPFVLIILAAVMIVAGVRGKQNELFSLLKSDVAGFLPWIVSIITIGALGYIKPIKPITDAFLILVIVVLFLRNGGFFEKIYQASMRSTATVKVNSMTQFQPMQLGANK